MAVQVVSCRALRWVAGGVPALDGSCRGSGLDFLSIKYWGPGGGGGGGGGLYWAEEGPQLASTRIYPVWPSTNSQVYNIYLLSIYLA